MIRIIRQNKHPVNPRTWTGSSEGGFNRITPPYEKIRNLVNSPYYREIHENKPPLSEKVETPDFCAKTTE
jgi:hypothetical protein